VAAGSRSSGGQAGGVMVLRQLFCGTEFFTALWGTPVVLAARTSWAAAAAATAVVGATVAVVTLSAARRTGCDVRRGERRAMVG